MTINFNANDFSAFGNVGSSTSLHPSSLPTFCAIETDDHKPHKFLLADQIFGVAVPLQNFLIIEPSGYDNGL